MLHCQMLAVLSGCMIASPTYIFSFMCHLDLNFTYLLFCQPCPGRALETE